MRELRVELCRLDLFESTESPLDIFVFKNAGDYVFHLDYYLRHIYRKDSPYVYVLIPSDLVEIEKLVRRLPRHKKLLNILK